jgi:hypothetical protein
MTPEQKPPITTRCINNHNYLIDQMVANFRKPLSKDFLNELFENWNRLQAAIEKVCQTNNIDPDTLQIYTNTVGIIEKATAQFAYMMSIKQCKSFDMRISEAQIRQLLGLKLTNFEKLSGIPSDYFRKENPNEQKPVALF